jgi:hypothetical protein
LRALRVPTIVSAAVIVAGCSLPYRPGDPFDKPVYSEELESQVRRGYTKSLSKVEIVLVSEEPEAAPFFFDLRHLLPSYLAAKGIAAQVEIWDSLPSDDIALDSAEKRSFHPAFLLYLKQKSMSKKGGKPSGGTFDLTLYEVGTKPFVWRAMLTTRYEFVRTVWRSAYDGGSYDDGAGLGIGRPDYAAMEIVDALTRDGLIEKSAGHK